MQNINTENFKISKQKSLIVYTIEILLLRFSVILKWFERLQRNFEYISLICKQNTLSQFSMS